MRWPKNFIFNHLARALRSKSEPRVHPRCKTAWHPIGGNRRRAGPLTLLGYKGESRMKTVLGAIALVMVMSAPALAQRSPYNGYQNPSFYNNQSPASPNYGGNGY